jgi:hypothetical protein
MMPAVGVPIDQLGPDPAYVQLIIGAVYDIRICHEIFDGWAAQLDKLRAKPSCLVFADRLNKTF